MAKQFAGFTPEQLGKIDPSLQGMQSDEQQKLIAANPALAARVGKMAEMAQQRIGMAQGGYAKKGYAVGGMPSPGDSFAEEAEQTLSDEEQTLTDAGERANELTDTALNDPGSLVTDTEVQTTTEAQRQEGMIDPTTGQITEPVPEVEQTVAEAAAPVEQPERFEAATVEPVTVSEDVQDTLDTLSAATGVPSDEALAQAATMSPEQLAQLGLSPAQIEEAQRVQAPEARTVQEGEMIEGSTVDMGRVKREVNFEAATGAPSTDATVQGQLTGLMEQFEGKEPPAWAAGAMRAAGAAMAARGISASSMAGQAIVQAAMESALPIAMQDAQTTAAFEQQNLSNKQQAAMFAAEKRAEFLGMEFNQEFQARVANAAKISDIANMNFTAEQQIALENARLAQSVDLANLNAANAKVLADAAAMTQVDITNLNNRQQAAVQNANAFLQMDMENLSNEQQTNVFKAQSMINAMFNDQAEVNAAAQFNASSENQVNQFFTDLGTRVALANTEQANLMNRFNAGEANAIALSGAAMREQRNQFEATNRLVIAQANAAWAQSITTTDNAAINEANRIDAQRRNEFTALGYNTAIQQYRDIMDYAWRGEQNDADRANQVLVTQMQLDQRAAEAASKRRSSFWGAVGSLFGAIF